MIFSFASDVPYVYCVLQFGPRMKTCWNSFSRTTWIDRCGFKVPDSFGTACTCVHWVCISVILYILWNKCIFRANARVCMNASLNCVLQRVVAIATRNAFFFNPLAVSPLTTKNITELAMQQNLSTSRLSSKS